MTRKHHPTRPVLPSVPGLSQAPSPSVARDLADWAISVLKGMAVAVGVAALAVGAIRAVVR